MKLRQLGRNIFNIHNKKTRKCEKNCPYNSKIVKAYQHTIVYNIIIDHGSTIMLKSPKSWDKILKFGGTVNNTFLLFYQCLYFLHKYKSTCNLSKTILSKPCLKKLRYMLISFSSNCKIFDRSSYLYHIVMQSYEKSGTAGFFYIKKQELPILNEGKHDTCRLY